MSSAIILAIVGYLFAWLVRLTSMWASPVAGSPAPSLRCTMTGLIAVGLHAEALFDGLLQGQHFNFSFFHTLSLVLLLINAIVVLSAVGRPVDQPGIITYPLAGLSLILTGLYPEPLRGVDSATTGMKVHILSSLIAFSLLAVSALQAVLLSVQDSCLRRRTHRGPILRSLPSLESTENLMFRLLLTGTVVLTLSLISGFLFLEDMFAQHLAHKTILAIGAWLLLVVLLMGRYLQGWRGMLAIRWTLAAFLTLLLAYLGSKFVLELILHRS